MSKTESLRTLIRCTSYCAADWCPFLFQKNGGTQNGRFAFRI
ncbi:hypothetical protein CHCC19467_3080 [Bacillus paralicheniformis]|nr:hypothetical protein CHCC19467_3080 [Bacillus paralicheniformis]